MREAQQRVRRRIPAPAKGVVFTLALLLCPFAVQGEVFYPADNSRTVSLQEETVSPERRGDDVLDARRLSGSDIARYRNIFELQKLGAWSDADKLIAQLEDDVLMGHVLYQRYMHPKKYRSRFGELKAWLDAYADHPDAGRVYRLANKRKPKGLQRPPRPQVPSNRLSYADQRTGKSYRSPRKRSRAEYMQVQSVKRYIRRNLRRDRLSASERYLHRRDVRRILDDVEQDEQHARIAGAWFYYGDDDKAYEIAHKAAERSRRHLGYPDWIAGLAAWRLGDMDRAAIHFEALAHSKAASSWNISAGAFWAARAHLVARRPERVNDLLLMAARHYRTFYGLIAARQLGAEIDFDWTMPPPEFADAVRLRDLPAAKRAVALTQVGRYETAERELRHIYLKGDASLGPALLTLAYRLELPALQLRLARGLKHSADKRYDKALFPLPPWRPAIGFSVDKALLFAIARQESGFEPKARSYAGARGLMQLMPRTASHVAGDRSLRRHNRSKLYDPLVNLDRGQRYVTELLGNDAVMGDLFRMAVAYNAGPGNLRKWLRKTNHKDDPLLFIESIPSRETRIFVEKVMSNFWIYRERLGQDTPSLDAVATGHAPIYFNLDSNTLKVADNGGR
jgi:soluble lytic murein transglycosylase-like protein